MARHPIPFSDDQLAAMYRMYTEEECSLDEVAAKYGISPHAVAIRLEKAGIPRRERGPSGNKKRAANTIAKGEAILKLLGQGMSKAEIAERLYIDRSVVQKRLKSYRAIMEATA